MQDYKYLILGILTLDNTIAIIEPKTLFVPAQMRLIHGPMHKAIGQHQQNGEVRLLSRGELVKISWQPGGPCAEKLVVDSVLYCTPHMEQ